MSKKADNAASMLTTGLAVGDWVRYHDKVGVVVLIATADAYARWPWSVSTTFRQAGLLAWVQWDEVSHGYLIPYVPGELQRLESAGPWLGAALRGDLSGRSPAPRPHAADRVRSRRAAQPGASPRAVGRAALEILM